MDQFKETKNSSKVLYKSQIDTIHTIHAEKEEIMVNQNPTCHFKGSSKKIMVDRCIQTFDIIQSVRMDKQSQTSRYERVEWTNQTSDNVVVEISSHIMDIEKSVNESKNVQGVDSKLVESDNIGTNSIQAVHPLLTDKRFVKYFKYPEMKANLRVWQTWLSKGCKKEVVIDVQRMIDEFLNAKCG